MSRDVQIVPVNDAPVLSTIEVAPVFYTENDSPIGITGNLAINDLDDTLIDTATITIGSGFASGEDILSFIPQFGITGNFDPVTGQLNLSGQALLTEYESVLHSVTYQNSSDNPSTATRTIDFVVNDGNISSNMLSRDIEFTTVNDAPVLSAIETAPASFTENDPPIIITNSLSISDVDDTTIDSAVVSINSNFVSGEDVLSFLPQFGITGSFDTVTGDLTLTGQALLTEYQTVLRSVTYNNTADNPSGLTRTIDFSINDGDNDSNLLSRDIQITPVNDAPVLSTIENAPAFYIENGSPVGITGNLSVNDIDDTQIDSATITISSGFAPGEDVLSFTPQFGINGSFDSATGQLNLSGQALLSEYETVLHSVSYQNSSDDPSAANRTIEFVVNDGTDDSNPRSRDIEFTAVNDAPILSTIEAAPAFYTENGLSLIHI